MLRNIFKSIVFLAALGCGSSLASDFTSLIAPTPATEGAAIAMRIQILPSEPLIGVRWFHNDGSQTFPRVVVVEADSDAPPDLSDPGLVLAEVAGASLDWGEVSLQTPAISSTGYAWIVFFFPEGVETVGAGTNMGPGLGIRQSAGPSPNRQFFLTADAHQWVRFDQSYQLGVEPVQGVARGQIAMISDIGVEIDRPELGTESVGVVLRTEFALPSPNPFNPRVTLRYSLAEPMRVSLKVFDVRGRLVEVIQSGSQPAGHYAPVWEGADRSGARVASGVYFALFEAGNVEQVRRMVLVR